MVQVADILFFEDVKPDENEAIVNQKKKIIILKSSYKKKRNIVNSFFG